MEMSKWMLLSYNWQGQKWLHLHCMFPLFSSSSISQERLFRLRRDSCTMAEPIDCWIIVSDRTVSRYSVYMSDRIA